MGGVATCPHRAGRGIGTTQGDRPIRCTRATLASSQPREDVSSRLDTSAMITHCSCTQTSLWPLHVAPCTRPHTHESHAACVPSAGVGRMHGVR